MKKCLLFIPLVLLLFIIFVSCSNEDLPYFQKNDPEPEFRLFNLLDDWPALRSMFNPIDQRTFNKLLAESLDDYLNETKDVVYLVDDLLTSKEHPVADTISNVRNLVNQIIQQDKLDRDPLYSHRDSLSESYYADGFYNLVDKISDNKLGLSENLINIAQKVISYIKNTYQGEELEEIMSDLVDFLRSDEPYLWRDGESTLTEDLGKLLLQANENVWLDSEGKIIADRDQIRNAGEIDTGCGNAARGFDTLMIAVNAMMKDDKLREDIFIILREVGKFFSAEVQGKKFKHVMQDLITNVKKYLTPGGEEYEKWEEYVWPNFNPYSGYGKDENNEFTDNKHRIYADGQLKNTLNYIFSSLQCIFIRAGREGAVLYDTYKEKTYFLEIFSKYLQTIEENPFDPKELFHHVEESFYDHCRFDMGVRDRLKTGSYDVNNYDPGREPSPMSNLESIFTLLFGTGVTAGWATANGKAEGIDTGELVNHPSQYYGNLRAHGFLTLGNAFNGFGLNYLLGINPFEIIFTDDIKDHLYRSTFYFDREERDNYRFHFDKEYGFLSFLSGIPMVKDSGFPDGGGPLYDENGEPVLNGYRAYSGVGLANNDFLGWLLGVLVHDIMYGTGPFYNIRKEKRDGDIYTYYRTNGDIYAHVIKPNPDDASTWDYIYPVDSATDAAGPAIFFSNVDLLTDGGIYLEDEGIVRINIDGIESDITFEKGKTWDQLSVIEKINKDNHFEGKFQNGPAFPAGRGFMITGENKDKAIDKIPEGIIEISNIEGNAVAELIKEGYNGERTLRQYAGRENRYYERWNSDYFLVEYNPIGSFGNPIYVNPADMSGNATQPGCLVAQELIPEHSKYRECPEFFCAGPDRNFQWNFAEMKLSIPLTLYLSITGDVIGDALDYLLFNYFFDYIYDDLSISHILSKDFFENLFNNIKLSIVNLIPANLGIPLTFQVEGNGLGALFNLKFPHGSEDNPILDLKTGRGRWVKDGGFDNSLHPGDFRLSVILPEKLIADELIDILKIRIPMLGPIDEILLGMPIEEFIYFAVGKVLYGGYLLGLKIDPLLGNNVPLAPTLMLNAQSLAHITYPRCSREQKYSKDGNNAVYNSDDDLLFGARWGDLCIDKNGNYRPEWGHEQTDDDPDWGNRGLVGWVVVILAACLRDYMHANFDLYDPNIVSSAVTHNGIGLFLTDMLGALALVPLSYYEKDTPDNKRPYNSWKQQIMGGTLKDDHKLGDDFYIDNGGALQTDYFLTPTDYIASSGIDSVTGDPLAPDPDNIFGGWALRNFYRMKDIRNIYNILLDSDPFAPVPKRCDGLLPLLTAYDVDRFTTNSDDPEKKVNTKLLTSIVGLVYDLGDSKYDDPYGPAGVDDDDMSTWGLRRKVCYGLEQFMTSLRLEKPFALQDNETNFKRIIHPQWTFYKDCEGISLGMRPEDVTFEVAQSPNPPEEENWTNFYRLCDALSELLSNNGETNGKYNIMEDVISFMEKLFTGIDASEENLISLRHSLGVLLTSYNKGGWEYPDSIAHILEDELPKILESFKGHYDNLLVLADTLLKDIDNGNGNGNFMKYFLKNFTSSYSAKDVVVQLHDFLGIDLVKRTDSSLWTELAELLVDFADMIEEDEQPGWFETDIFHSNKDIMESTDPFRAVGEILSW
ncbi:MAG: hypothetical protein SVZ03_02050 [Spirochaetota bacterium]|nr:hypothetical protein [Spirochaetota bacterium]